VTLLTPPRIPSKIFINEPEQFRIQLLEARPFLWRVMPGGPPEVALDTHREVLLVVLHGVDVLVPVELAPQLPPQGVLVQALQPLLEVGEGGLEAEEVDGVGELVDGDVLVPVGVVGVAQHVLLRVGPHGVGQSGADASVAGVPSVGIGLLEPGVLWDVICHFLHPHDRLAELSSLHLSDDLLAHVLGHPADDEGRFLQSYFRNCTGRHHHEAGLGGAQALVEPPVGKMDGVRNNSSRAFCPVCLVIYYILEVVMGFGWFIDISGSSSSFVTFMMRFW